MSKVLRRKSVSNIISVFLQEFHQNLALTFYFSNSTIKIKLEATDVIHMSNSYCTMILCSFSD